jgi:PIN domain nuclease of toxin-antitoxin system
VFIWWNGRAEILAPRLREAIANSRNEVFVSAASVWEIGLKRAIGKLSFSRPIVPTISAHRFQLLPITGEHAEAAAELLRHHTDPFDRLLVAQADLEGLVLGTHDRKLEPYGIAVLGSLRRDGGVVRRRR